MDEYRELARQADAASIRKIIDDLSGESEKPAYRDGMNVRLACVITGVRLKSTKNGSMMAYVTVEDESAPRSNWWFSRVRCSSAARI